MGVIPANARALHLAYTAAADGGGGFVGVVYLLEYSGMLYRRLPFFLLSFW